MSKWVKDSISLMGYCTILMLNSFVLALQLIHGSGLLFVHKHFLSIVLGCGSEKQQVGWKTRIKTQSNVTLTVHIISDSLQGKTLAVMRGEPKDTAKPYFWKNQNTKGTKLSVLICLRGSESMFSLVGERRAHMYHAMHVGQLLMS
jgi:hypothetical protein